jgi:iron complex transport system substrate-binding protein
MRIVSLVPSATEIVCALGLGDALVGISHDCDFPPEILDRPVLSGAVAGPGEASAAVDARIRGAVHAGRSVYHLDQACLRRLRPDLILTQELCVVCAPSHALVRRAARLLEGETRIVSLDPRRFEDVLENIRLVGALTGTESRAAVLVADLQARMDGLRAAPLDPRPRVVCLEWLDPLYAGGHWIPEMVEAAGGVDALGVAGAPSRSVAWGDLREAQPETIVLMPCGWGIARTRAELGCLSGRPGWTDLPAVRQGRVFLTDGSSYFNRPGPRLVTGAAVLAAILNPSRDAGHLPAGAVERA